MVVPFIDRERLWWAKVDGHNQLMLNYFAPLPLYPERYFHCRFWMGTGFLNHIEESMKSHESFFEQRRNCTKDLGHSTY
jgi:hypothetical protein